MVEIRAGAHRLHLVRLDHPTETIDPSEDAADALVDRALAWARRKIAARPAIELETDPEPEGGN
jgi:hypothetical protein